MVFGTSVFGGEIAAATGLPINAFAESLYFADIAYFVGFGVAFGAYWIGARLGARRPGRRGSAL